MSQDACTGYKQKDAKLNQIYNKIIADHKDDQEFLAKFKAAQRAWLRFRDSELQALYPSTEPATYGSSLPMCECLELSGLTDARLQQLQRWVGGDEGDVCAGSR